MLYRNFILTMFIFMYAAPVVSDPLRNFLTGFNAMQSRFTQIQMDASGRELDRVEGVLYLQQPGKLHWAYEKPYLQKIITDGETLWIFDEDLEQVTIRRMKDIIHQTPAGIILGDANIDHYFTQKSLGNIEGADWIEFTPIDAETPYKNIRFGFDDNKLLMMIIADNLDRLIRIDFKDVSEPLALSPALFTFEVPADVDVIDERRLSEGN